MNLEIPPPPPPQPTHWRRAFRELRALIANPDETDHAIHLIYALGRQEFERNFQRFAASPGGRALLAERPSLLAALSDRESLARLPEKSLGRAYLAYLDRQPLRTRWPARGPESSADALAARRGRAGARSAARVVPRPHASSPTTCSTCSPTTEPTGSARPRCSRSRSPSSAAGGRPCSPSARRSRCGASTAGAGWSTTSAPSGAAGARPGCVTLPWEELLPLRVETVRRLARVAEASEVHPGGVLRDSLDEQRVPTLA